MLVGFQEPADPGMARGVSTQVGLTLSAPHLGRCSVAPAPPRRGRLRALGLPSWPAAFPSYPPG